MIAQGCMFPLTFDLLTLVTVILLLMSAALASRGDDNKIEIIDPKDRTKTLVVEEKYPGESTWFDGFYAADLIRRLSQIASEEDRLRAEGKIDTQGHLKNNGKNGDKAKKSEEKEKGKQ